MSWSTSPSITNLPADAIQLLRELFSNIEEALGDHLVGAYLRGSIALGDFDPATSDIDFLVVTRSPVSDEQFAVLNDLHTRISRIPNRYAEELEGAYIDCGAVRRFRAGERHPTLERGERLRWQEHRANWVLERWVLREHGVTVTGPEARALIDPVSADQLRDAVRNRLRDWAEWACNVDDPDWYLPLSHKAYVVETMCRALYTMATGALCSKPKAVAWACHTLSEPWRSFVERSRAWRTDRSLPAPETVEEVRRFVQWAAATVAAWPVDDMTAR